LTQSDGLPPKLSAIRLRGKVDDPRIARLDIVAEGRQYSFLVTREAFQMIAGRCIVHSRKMQGSIPLN